MEVEVRAFGDQNVTDGNPVVRGFELDKSGFGCPKALESVFGASRRCVDFAAAGGEADLVHTHTWYTQLGGLMAKYNYGMPLVTTVHSLEPLRPWKREQLGGGYDWSCWVERQAMEQADAVIAVSRETRHDVMEAYDVKPERVHIIYNGIDPEEYRPVAETDALERYGVDPARPYILFVGRITRQKGIVHLVHAISRMDEGFQVVLCAGAPDTEEIAREMEQAVGEAKKERGDIVWIAEKVDQRTKVQFYSHAALFVCPSIYEPFGIINLEAMACETPVVGAAVGGIKEVVEHGVTGLHVPLRQMDASPFDPLHPERFSHDLAMAVNELMRDRNRRERMGRAGRERAVETFSWRAIAEQTRDLYASLV
jgi:glycogen synthase